MKTTLTIQKAVTNAEKVGKRGQRFNSERLTPYVFLIPAAVFWGAVPCFPIIYSFVISFQKSNLATLVSRNAEFLGSQNFQALLGNPAFGVALTHSPSFTFFSLVYQFAIGLGLAILFNKALPPHHLMRGVLLLARQFYSCIFFHRLRYR